MGKGIGDDENEKLIWGSGSMKRDTQMVLERERERGGENLFVCVSGCGKVECDGDRFLCVDTVCEEAFFWGLLHTPCEQMDHPSETEHCRRQKDHPKLIIIWILTTSNQMVLFLNFSDLFLWN